MTQETNTVEVVRAQGDKKERSYIVHLKASVDKDAHLQWLRQRLSGNSEIKDNYSFLNAFSGTFNEDTLSVLRTSSDVDRIEEVGYPTTSQPVRWRFAHLYGCAARTLPYRSSTPRCSE